MINSLTKLGISIYAVAKKRFIAIGYNLWWIIRSYRITLIVQYGHLMQSTSMTYTTSEIMNYITMHTIGFLKHTEKVHIYCNTFFDGI